MVKTIIRVCLCQKMTDLLNSLKTEHEQQLLKKRKRSSRSQVDQVGITDSREKQNGR